MWIQPTIGVFENGDERFKIDTISHSSYILWRNEDYIEDFDSYEELNAHLNELGLGNLYLPEISEVDKKWHNFGVNENYEQVFSRKKEFGLIESVIVAKFSDDTYSVYSRETDYNCVDCLIEASIEFVQFHKKNPKNDLEVDSFEISTHGASGMDECHRNLKSYEEVLNVLKEPYGIEI